MTYVGIDPGVASGALAVITHRGRYVSVYDAPYAPTAKRGRNEPDFQRVAEIMDTLDLELVRTERVERAFIEVIAPQGSVINRLSVHSLAMSYASWLQALARRFPVQRIEVKDWQATVGLKYQKGWTDTQKKKATCTLARELFPDAPLELAKHHGRAGALLIAEAGRRMIV